MPKSTLCYPRAAFTLTELLAVIAIIFFLAAILFPVFGWARENARRSSCQSNAYVKSRQIYACPSDAHQRSNI